MTRHVFAAVALASSVVAPAAASAETYYVQMGYPVMLVTRTDLSTRDNRSGDRFYLEVAENVSAKGQVIIPVGSVATGEIIHSERNGHFGKSGKIGVRVLYIDTPTMRIPLTGNSAGRGKSGTVPTVAAIAAFGLIGGLVHGTSGRIRAGTPVQAYLADDLKFTLRNENGEQSARVYVPATSGKLAARDEFGLASAR